ncbi:hypothetical protein CAPTEDRAFT_228583 [Capitella teleta]|uniref:IgGFc-binding protein N-terminal domain-containing protein n=1 Tax=Capitella teleta TaxID=283909 RepID=R7V971_CAPTE|nr:hypothetical protein CAPTEDRAFT_228583 [Capitella teleta]|eukprot:ELU15114.1 hypothetical protein CAPTEDRAFT_228583 [Capitella teleta]
MKVMASLFVLAVILGGFSAASSAIDLTNEIFMLAFMNITTDDPTLSDYQQIIPNAFHEGTQLYARTYDASMTINYEIPMQPTGGIIGDHSLQTQQTLVASVDDVITKLGLFVVADNKVSLQLSKSVQASSDGYVAIPLTEGSTEFYVASYDPFPGSHSTYAIAALEDNTCVEVYSVNGSQHTRVAFVSLDSFEVYNGLSDTTDFTGYHVLSTKPVTVLGGHMCAQVPKGILFCDHISSQLPPVEEWGTEFVVPGIRGRRNTAGYIYRVLGSVDDTKVRLDGTAVATISRGSQFYEGFVDRTFQSIVISCSQPCLVVQYNVGYLYDNQEQSSNDQDLKRTDPYMMLIPAMRNYLTTLRFGTANYIADETVQEFENHLALVVPTGSKGMVTLNLEYLPTDTLWTDLLNGYSVTNFEIDHGLYNVRSDTGDVKMMAFVYGHGRSHITAYGYPAGYKTNGEKIRTCALQKQSGVGDGNYDELEGTCEEPFNPAVVGPADNLQRLYITFQLKSPLSEPCSTLALNEMEGVLKDVKNVTNWLICLDLLCIPAENTWVYSVDIVEPTDMDPLTSMTFLVTLWSSSSEVMKNAIGCKRHVAEYLGNYGTHSERWKVPLAVPGVGCADLDFQVPANVTSSHSRGSMITNPFT